MPAVHSRISIHALVDVGDANIPSAAVLAASVLQFSNDYATGEFGRGMCVGDVSAFADPKGLVRDFNAPVPPLSLNGTPGPKSMSLLVTWPGVSEQPRYTINLFKNNSRLTMGELAGKICRLVAEFLRTYGRLTQHPSFRISDTGLPTPTCIGLSDVFILGIARHSTQAVFVPVFQVRSNS